MRPRQMYRSSSRPVAPVEKTASVRRHRPDYWLVALSALLLAIGLIVVFSIGPAIAKSSGTGSNYFVTRQLIAIALSVVVFLVTSRIPINRWRDLRKPLLIAAVVATVLALISPLSEQYQEHRWVRLGGFTFQSVELVKFAIMIWLAALLSYAMASGAVKQTNKVFKPLLVVLGLSGVIVAGAQSDLGSMGVIFVMMIAMAFVAGMPLKQLALIGGIVAIGAILAVSATPYRRDRLDTFLNPTADCQDAGYQACQAMNAVGSGGLLGLGLGGSVEAYGYLPEAANDSIFAIYAEKFGFVGSIILLIIFGTLFARIASIAERAADDFSRLITVGVLTWLSIQSIVNIGAMIGLLPLKGITLPFISYGGTSVIFIAAAIGLVFQISHYTTLGTVWAHNGNGRDSYDDSRNRRRIGGAYHPDLGGRARA